MSSRHQPKKMPNQQHYQIRTHTRTLNLIHLQTQMLLLQSSSLYLDRPWLDENCFVETSESSKRNSNASYGTSSSCHHQNHSSCLFESLIHVSLTRRFWMICDTC